MYEFESRWTRGMKSRWTDHLDEPTLPPFSFIELFPLSVTDIWIFSIFIATVSWWKKQVLKKEVACPDSSPFVIVQA